MVFGPIITCVHNTPWLQRCPECPPGTVGHNPPFQTPQPGDVCSMQCHSATCTKTLPHFWGGDYCDDRRTRSTSK